MKLFRLFGLLALCGTTAVLAQEKGANLKPIDIAELKREEPISYEKEVLPIFEAKCTVCHSGSLLEGDYDMGTHAAVMKGGKRGKVVIPGKADESLLWLFSSHRKGPIMPPKSERNPLDSKEVAILKLWIDQGAKGPAVDERKRHQVVLSLPPVLVNPVRAVNFSPSAEVVAAGRGNQIHLFESKTGDFQATLSDPELKTADGKPANAAHISLVESMAYSPDGKTLASGSFGEVALWDVESGKLKKRIDGFADRVVTLDFNPDGTILAAGGGAPTEDGEVKLIKVEDGSIITDLPECHSDTVFGVRFSADGKLLATCGADKFVKVFEIPSGKLVKSFEGHTNHVLDVGWTPDGKKLASAGADYMIKIWDFEKGEKIRDIKGPDKQYTRLSFVGNTPTFLTAGGDANVRLYNADNGGQVRAFGGSEDFLYAVAANKDGTLVAAGGEEGLIRIYNGGNAQLIKAVIPPEPGQSSEKKPDSEEKSEKDK